MFLPTLRSVAESLNRKLDKPSVTELIAGTRETYLKKTQPYAVDPMRWAVCSGVISGIPTGSQLSLQPEGTATRAQAAKMFLVFRSLDGLFVS